MKTPTLLLQWFLFSFLGLLYYPAALYSQERTDNVLKIGFIGALSGPAAIYGVASKNGIEMALEDLGENSRIKVYYEDDQFQSAKTIAAYRKLRSLEKIQIFISIASTPSHALAPLVQKDKTVLFAWASDAKVSQTRDYVIRTYPSGHQEGVTAAQQALKKDYDHFGAVYSENDYATSVVRGFSDIITKEHLLFEEETPPQTPDFKPTLLRARQRGAQSIYLCLNPGQSSLFARQARELQYAINIFGCENLNSREERSLSDGGLDSAWFVTIGTTDAFRNRYVQRYGNEDVLSGAAVHYDLIHLLHAISGQDLSVEKLREKLFSFPPQSGALPKFQFRMESGDQYMDIPLILKQVSDL
ncbi:MAG: ABC transporter substrate-binding protein [Bdellovibrionales bacterium]|nr:ABC transporter substrate-binding protein [Bdellovibrionales bacterium]